MKNSFKFVFFVNSLKVFIFDLDFKNQLLLSFSCVFRWEIKSDTRPRSMSVAKNVKRQKFSCMSERQNEQKENLYF